MSSVIYDAGMLIALERLDRRAVIHHEQVCDLVRPLLPVSVLAQVLRAPAKQAVLNRAVKQCQKISMSEQDAREMGPLMAAAETADVVDAHVVILAQRLGAVVYSSDPDDLRKLDSSLRIIAV